MTAEGPETAAAAEDEGDEEEDEDAFTGWHTIEPREVAMLLIALIGALLIWAIFIYVHKGG